MPFKSEKQRRYLWLKHPDIAKRWADTYPTKKDLPMYADDTKDTEKQSIAAQILNGVLPNNLRKFANPCPPTVYSANTKRSDSKQEYVKLPEKQGPTFAGESEAQAVSKPVGDGLNDNNAPSPEKQDQMTANVLFKKLAVVLSPVLMQEIENEQAMQQARNAQRMPKNIGVRHTPPAVNSILPPMGMTQPAPNPGQAQPAQPAQPQQPANGQLAGVGGGNSPNANPINSFSGLSSTGDINGNAALGTHHMAGGEKMSGNFDFLRPAQPPKQPPTFEKTLGRGIMNILTNGAKPQPKSAPAPVPPLGKSSAAGDNELAWLMSIDNCNTPDPDDFDYAECVKSAVEKWAGAGLWANIRAKKKRGGKPAKPGSKDYPDAKSWDKVTSISAKQAAGPVQPAPTTPSPGFVTENGMTRVAGTPPLPPPAKPYKPAPMPASLMSSQAEIKAGPVMVRAGIQAPTTTSNSLIGAGLRAGANYLNGGLGLRFPRYGEAGPTSAPAPEPVDGLAKASAAKACSCGCGDTVNTCKCSATCSCRKPGGSCYKPEQKKSAALGLWDRIRAKKKRGGKPAKPGSKDYPDAKSWDKVTSISEKKSGTPAWQRSTGKNDEGGLNAKGRASYNKSTGGNLKAPVTESKPSGSRAKRQNSFCSRMCGMKKHETGSKTKKDPESRINKALRKWNCKCANCAGQPFEVIKSANLERMLTAALVSAGGGLALGAYPGFKLQQASERAGNPEFVNSFVGRIPIAAAGALSGGLYNYLREQQDSEAKRKPAVAAI